MSLEKYLKQKARVIDHALNQYLPRETAEPAVIHRAMRYAVLGSGKRIRPILTLAVCEACGGSQKDALLPACAIELIHSYSLIHDDLPALDNDDLRRGKPSCHKKFGEAIAILAGDALLTLAFELLSKMSPSKNNFRLIKEIAGSAGTSGMIGGQVMDIETGDACCDVRGLNRINQLKTGELIRISCVAGAIAAGASKNQEKHISNFGRDAGFIFQLVDDIIDRDGYTRLKSTQQIRKQAGQLTEVAKRELRIFRGRGKYLSDIVDFVLNRRF